MPFCNKCGTELRLDDVFCPECGQKTNFSEQSNAEPAKPSVSHKRPSANGRPSNRSNTQSQPAKTESTPRISNLNTSYQPYQSDSTSDVFDKLSFLASKRPAANPSSEVQNKRTPRAQASKPPVKKIPLTADDEDIIKKSTNQYLINNEPQLDIRKSWVFGRLHDMGPTLKSQDRLDNAVIVLAGSYCKNLAEMRRGFPARDLLMKAYRAADNNDFGALCNALTDLADPLESWLESKLERGESDLEALCLYGSILAAADNKNANYSLLGVLMGSLRGIPVDSGFCSLWMMAAIYSNFESWLKTYAGVYMVGPSPFHGKKIET